MLPAGLWTWPDPRLPPSSSEGQPGTLSLSVSFLPRTHLLIPRLLPKVTHLWPCLDLSEPLVASGPRGHKKILLTTCLPSQSAPPKPQGSCSLGLSGSVLTPSPRASFVRLQASSLVVYKGALSSSKHRTPKTHILCHQAREDRVLGGHDAVQALRQEAQVTGHHQRCVPRTFPWVQPRQVAR